MNDIKRKDRKAKCHLKKLTCQVLRDLAAIFNWSEKVPARALAITIYIKILFIRLGVSWSLVWIVSIYKILNFVTLTELKVVGNQN